MSRLTSIGTALRALGFAAAFAAAAASWPSGTARAAGAVGIKNWDGGVATATLASVGDSAAASAQAGGSSSMSGNPALNGSAWAHTGSWWNIQLGALPELRIRVDAQNASEFAPGLAVWAIGDAVFDGGTTSFGNEISSAGFGTPHSFNATGALGNAGTLWMKQGQGGNATEALGYAIAGPSVAGVGGWGETLANGAHDTRLSDDYVASVGGSVGSGFAELSLIDVAPGWYLIYVGGTDHALAGGLFDLDVRAVPEPGTIWMLVAGVGALGVGRKQRAR
jgi:hypothetical protein